MALIGTIASGAQNSSVSSVGLVTNMTLAVGQTIIGTVVVEAAAGTNPTLTVSDVFSNSYSVDVQQVNGTTTSVSIFSCRVTTQIASGSTITIAASNGTRSRWAITVQAFDDVLTPRLDKIASNAATGTSLSSGTTPSTTAANELLYAGFAFGTGRTFTPGTSFTASAQVATTAGTTDRAANSEWRYISSIGAQSATATINTSSVYAGAIATYFSQSSNVAPTADAGPDQTVTVGTAVTLDGSASSDSDGTIASYAWQQLSGSSVTLSSASVVRPTFTAPGMAGSLVFGLTVTDNLGATSTQDTVTVTVGARVGYVGQAVSGTQQTNGTFLTLPLSKAVGNGHTLLIGVTVDAGGGSDSSPVFTVTDTKGNSYVVDAVAYRPATLGVAIISAFIVTPLTTGDSITITCTTTRSRWAVNGSEFDTIAQNGKDVTAINNGAATLNLSSGTTPASADHYAVVFSAFGFNHTNSQTFSPGAHYTQAGTQQSTTAGSADRAVATEYRFFSTVLAHQATGTLNATSGYGAAIVAYAALSTGNQLPVANAGSDQIVDAFASVTLDGTASSDEDGLISGYSWLQTAGPTVALSSATAAQPTFIAPGVNNGTSLTFRLVVTDNSGGSSSLDTVTIVVNTAERFFAHSSAWQPIPEYTASAGSWL